MNTSADGKRLNFNLKIRSAFVHFKTEQRTLKYVRLTHIVYKSLFDSIVKILSEPSAPRNRDK